MKSKKRFLIISLILITVLIGLGLYIFVDIGNKPKYYINLGDTFKIKLHANGSTGYSNCWINEDKSDKVKLINEQYKSSLTEKLGYVGAGGTLVWTFKGVKPGIDTIKIAFCPTGPLQKDCNDFKVDSIEPDYQFSKYRQ